MIDRYVSPEELRRLISALLVVMIFICIVALFAFLIVPGTRNANRPESGPAVDAPQGESGWLDPTDYPPALGYTIPPVDPKTVMTATPALLTRGQALYGQNCSPCHGPTGHGDGPAAKGLNPPPRNFTQNAGWKNGYQKEGIWKTLQEGVKGSGMVAYDYLPQKDRMALVHYVQSLGAFDHGPEDPKKLDEMAKMFASAGEVVPAKIPVARAMVRLEDEYSGVPALAETDAWPPVLRRSIVDPAAAARTLAGLSGWSKDPAALARGIVRGLPFNGFDPAVATYAPEQWAELQSGLAGIKAPRTRLK